MTTEEELPAIRCFKVMVVAALIRCWSFHSIYLMSSPALSSALDPRLKALKFLSGVERVYESPFVQLASQQETYYSDEHASPACKKKKTSLDEL